MRVLYTILMSMVLSLSMSGVVSAEDRLICLDSDGGRAELNIGAETLELTYIFSISGEQTKSLNEYTRLPNQTHLVFAHHFEEKRLSASHATLMYDPATGSLHVTGVNFFPLTSDEPNQIGVAKYFCTEI